MITSSTSDSWMRARNELRRAGEPSCAASAHNRQAKLEVAGVVQRDSWAAWLEAANDGNRGAVRAERRSALGALRMAKLANLDVPKAAVYYEVSPILGSMGRKCSGTGTLTE
jgi:hypothetical protein